jgi:carbonic anhydrase
VAEDVFEELFDAGEQFHERFAPDGLTAAPTRHVVVLSCMDARLDLFRLLGLAIGDAHILRNAGGRATDDAIRSLVVSANWLGTRRALVIHHTQCGLYGQTNESMREHVRDTTGHDPVDMEFHAITDLEASVRDDVRRIRATPFLPDGYEVRGAIYDVETGALTPVSD